MSDASDVNLDLEVAKGLIAKVGMAVSGFASTVIFTQFLEPSELGLYFVLMAAVIVANRPAMGLVEACKKRVSEHNSNQNELVGVAFLAVVGISTVVLTAVAMHSVLEIGSIPPQAPLFFGALFVAITADETFRMLIDASGRVSTTTFLNFARSIGAMIFQVGLLLLGFKTEGLIAGMVLASLLVLPVSYRYLGIKAAKPSISTIKSVLEYGKYSIPTSITWRVFDEFDVILLSAMVSGAAAGYYGVAWKLTIPAVFVVTLLAGGLMAKVSNLDSKGESISDALHDSLSMSSIFATPLFFGVLAVGTPIIETVYRPEYTPAVAYLVLLALFQVLRSQTAPLGATFRGLDRPDIMFRGSFLALGTNVVLGVILVLAYGGVGVAIATVTAATLHYIYYAQVLTGMERNLNLFTKSTQIQFLAGGIMFIFASLVWHIAPSNSLWLALTIAASGAIYIATVFAFDSAFRKRVGGILPGFIPLADIGGSG